MRPGAKNFGHLSKPAQGGASFEFQRILKFCLSPKNGVCDLVHERGAYFRMGLGAATRIGQLFLRFNGDDDTYEN